MLPMVITPPLPRPLVPNRNLSPSPSPSPTFFASPTLLSPFPCYHPASPFPCYHPPPLTSQERWQNARDILRELAPYKGESKAQSDQVRRELHLGSPCSPVITEELRDDYSKVSVLP